jgi:hypothetical protein
MNAEFFHSDVFEPISQKPQLGSFAHRPFVVVDVEDARSQIAVCVIHQLCEMM